MWKALAEDADARLARAETESNLHLNLSKIEPRSVREIVVLLPQSPRLEGVRSESAVPPSRSAFGTRRSGTLRRVVARS